MTHNQFAILLMVLSITFQGCAPVSSTSIPRAGEVGSGDGGGEDPGNNPPGVPDDQLKVQSLSFSASRPVDIMLVIDNSLSMESDSLQLATRMSDFVRELKQRGMDWQMCLSTTNIEDSTNTYAWKVAGESKFLLSRSDLEGKTDSEAVGIFTNSVKALFSTAKSGDERGVAALYVHADSKNSRDQSCYRPGAVLSTIVLSDEDERSFGGNKKYFDSKDSEPRGNGVRFETLERIDYPVEYLKKTTELGIPNVISHSIITDSVQCRNQQRANFKNDGVSVGHIGTIYQELSRRTGGHVGSICDANYSRHLLDFADAIDNSLSSILLSCLPKVDTLEVSSPTKMVGVDFTFSLEGSRLNIRSLTNDAFDVDVKYYCR